MHAMPIGEILVADGALSAQQLRESLAQTRGRIGDFLHAHGLVDGRSLARAVASQMGLVHIDILTAPAEKHLYSPRDLPLYITYQFLPYKHRGGVLTIATPEPSEELRAFAQSHYRMPVTFVVITPRDLAHYFATRAATTGTRHSRLGLRRAFPHLVADRIFHRHQAQGLVLMLLMMAAGFAAFPASVWAVLMVACNIFYLAALLIKSEFYRQGIRNMAESHQRLSINQIRAAQIPDDALPIYSILVPLFKERSEVMARLIDNLNALDYPKEKLDIKLICEADDQPTLDALKALSPPSTMQIISVPRSLPRTKPKACNVAMAQLRGEFAVIYDAEDAPAPEQLRMAVSMFRDGPENLACLQASLNYYNRDENLLTQLFSIEYSALFRVLLPGLERMGLPIPLGGTSNHLKVAVLRKVGGWDAFNVTEDADLGVRLHYMGYATRTMPSLTLEESPVSLIGWLKQRTRWIKGYIQTWLVYTRNPAELKRRLGSEGYYGFQFFIGAPALTFLLAPLFWLVFFESLFDLFPIILPPAILWLCAASFVAGTLSHWLFARKVLEIEGWGNMRAAFWLYPLYWLLHSLAAMRALVQLIAAPHYWDKTRHGMSRMGR